MIAQFEFRVPATSANLGPGFGVLGLALDLAFAIRVEVREEVGHVVERPDSDDDSTLDLRHDSIIRGLRTAAETWTIELPPGLAVITSGEVPRGCGLGTNSADFATGIRAAVHFAKDEPSLDEQLALLAVLGGDPAHGAAALFGGLVVAVPVHRASEPPRFVCLRHDIHPDWRFVIVAPAAQIGTAEVYRVVPAQLPNVVTLRTAGRLIGLLRALENGDEELLRPCLVDEVHVPFRRGLLPGLEAAMDAARDAGAAGVTISGHGPALIAMTMHDDRVEAIASAMVDAFGARDVEARTIATRAWRQSEAEPQEPPEEPPDGEPPDAEQPAAVAETPPESASPPESAKAPESE